MAKTQSKGVRIRARSALKLVTPQGTSLDLTLPKGAKLGQLFGLMAIWLAREHGVDVVRELVEKELREVENNG